jgi:predicted metal-dependent peptidase
MNLTINCLAEEKLIKSRSRLMRRDIGIASMLLSLDLVKSEKCDTMATDGQRIIWNENFVKKCSDSEIEAVLIHEALHVVFEHPLRRSGRNHKLWNIACDYAINSYIVYDLRLTLPEGGLLNNKYHKLSAEQIYRILDTNDDALQEAINEAKEKNQSSDEENDSSGEQSSQSSDSDTSDDEGSGENSSDADSEDADGELVGGSATEGEEEGDKYSAIPSLAGEVIDAQDEDGKPLSDAQKDELSRAIRSKIFLADKTASLMGSSSLRGAVEKIGVPTNDLPDAIREFLTGSVPSLSSWNRLNKRHSWRGVNLPTYTGDKVGGELAVAIDTSCSMSQPELNFCANVVQFVCEELSIEKIRVCYCDTTVRKNDSGEWWDVTDLSSGEELKFELRGGGGTSFDPPFNLFNEYSDDVHDVCAFIYFTDGFGSVEAENEPDVPVLWAVTHAYNYREPKREHIPFGDFIPVDVSSIL